VVTPSELCNGVIFLRKLQCGIKLKLQGGKKISTIYLDGLTQCRRFKR